MAEQQQGQQDSTLEFLYTLVALGVLLVGAWFLWRKSLTKALLYLRIGELSVVDFVLAKVAALLGGLVKPQMEVLTYLISAKQALNQTVETSYLLELSKVTYKYIQYPTLLVMGIFGTILCFTKGLKQFRLVFDTRSLRKLEQYNWPQISPVVELNLVDTKLDDGQWAMSVSPMQYCKRHKQLLNIQQKADGSYEVHLNRSIAYRELSLQLGAVWRGVKVLPLYLQALFAAFAARMNEDKNGAERMLDHLSASITGRVQPPTVEEIDKLLNKHLNCKAVKMILGRHAYVTTVMASMLEGARTVGVLATSEFIWLKPLDRRMWYMLNSVGRTTAMAEICGAFAHWLAEKKLESALLSPMVDEAVTGLEAALQEIIYKPDEE